uniref:Uncharacterized protein n=1 Tax=Ramularia collo-cygni TaxID=112498 RepID=A0A2D3VKX0_9PEZI
MARKTSALLRPSALELRVSELDTLNISVVAAVFAHAGRPFVYEAWQESFFPSPLAVPSLTLQPVRTQSSSLTSPQPSSANRRVSRTQTRSRMLSSQMVQRLAERERANMLRALRRVFYYDRAEEDQILEQERALKRRALRRVFHYDREEELRLRQEDAGEKVSETDEEDSDADSETDDRSGAGDDDGEDGHVEDDVGVEDFDVAPAIDDSDDSDEDIYENSVETQCSHPRENPHSTLSCDSAALRSSAPTPVHVSKSSASQPTMPQHAITTTSSALQGHSALDMVNTTVATRTPQNKRKRAAHTTPESATAGRRANLAGRAWL